VACAGVGSRERIAGEVAVMSLETKTLAELIDLKQKLSKAIQSNPLHSGGEQVELEAVRDYIELRMRGQERAKLFTEPTFDVADQ
jgi:hypothetical protein